MNREDRDVIEFRKALLGFIDNMQKALKKVPEHFEKIAKLLNEFNRLSTKLPMIGLSGGDKKLLQRTANTFEKRIRPYMEAVSNLKQKERPRSDALKELKEIENELKRPKPKG